MKVAKLLGITILAAMTVPSVMATGIKYQNDKGQSVNLTGNMQWTYRYTDAQGKAAVNDILLRSLRLGTEGSLYENWTGKFQFDLGQGVPVIKDAFVRYDCCKNCKVTVGNMYMPFSREVLSGSYLQENAAGTTLVGSRDYGTPDRQAGVHVAGTVLDDKLALAASACRTVVDPDNSKICFDSIVSPRGTNSDWNLGYMFGGRIEYAPWGQVKFSQGDLEKSKKASVAVGAYSWQNDNKNLSSARSNDVDSVVGVELSGAVRYHGLSVDAECNLIDSSLKDDGITSGLYKDSETRVVNYAVEAGYMVLPGQLEAVLAYESQDADNYAKTWNRITGGLNYFVKGHDIKYQLSYTAGQNKGGKANSDVDEIYLQAQYLF